MFDIHFVIVSVSIFFVMTRNASTSSKIDVGIAAQSMTVQFLGQLAVWVSFFFSLENRIIFI